MRAASQTDRAPVEKMVKTCFSELHSELNSYLSDIDRTSVKLNWARNPFGRTEQQQQQLQACSAAGTVDGCVFRLWARD